MTDRMRVALSLTFLFLSAGYGAMALWAAALGLWLLIPLDVLTCVASFYISMKIERVW